MTMQQNNIPPFLYFAGKGIRWTMQVLLVITIAICTTVVWLVRSCGSKATTEASTTFTPTHITELRSIGQWEFLAISDELLVDTVRHGFFGDDELARIYYGTLRLGIDLSQLADQQITSRGDTVQVTLPPVRLLDERFLDEAATKSFYEEGSWTEADRKAMAQRARQQMRARCMTKQNIAAAEQNAKTQVAQLLRAMGYGKVSVAVEHSYK